MLKGTNENYKFIRLDVSGIEKVAEITKELREKTGKFYSRETFIRLLIERFANINKEKILLEYKEELLKAAEDVKFD